MKTTEPIEINGKTYHYDGQLSGGYYSAKEGWHNFNSSGKYVYNYDKEGKLFFNVRRLAQSIPKEF